jgi:hypothetical protein
LPGRNRHGLSFAVSAVFTGRLVSVAEYSVTDVQISSAPDGMGATTTTTTSNTRHLTIAVVRLPQPFAEISVQRRGPASKVGRALFGDRITATGNERFDRRFRIITADAQYARRMVGPALAAAHVQDEVPLWSIYGSELLAYWAAQIGDPEAIPGFAGSVLRVAELISH